MSHPGLPQDAHWPWSSACEGHTASPPPHLHGVFTPPLLGTRSPRAWPGPEGPPTVQQLWCWGSCSVLGVDTYKVCWLPGSTRRGSTDPHTCQLPRLLTPGSRIQDPGSDPSKRTPPFLSEPSLYFYYPLSKHKGQATNSAPSLEGSGRVGAQSAHALKSLLWSRMLCPTFSCPPGRDSRELSEGTTEMG